MLSNLFLGLMTIIDVTLGALGIPSIQIMDAMSNIWYNIWG